MDIVYPIGRGSQWYNNELRFSLRSVEKHLKGFQNIYIVGLKPNFCKNVIHAPYVEIHEKERNIMEKVKLACSIPELSEDFIFMNDDHLICKDIEAKDIGFYYSMTIEEMILKRNAGFKYRAAMENTIKNLEGKPHLYYDIHTPIIYNKQKFVEVMDFANWEVKHGNVVKSLYANSVDVEPIEMGDIKINGRFTEQDLETKFEERLFISYSDRAICNSFKNILLKKYPNKSKYE